MITIRDASQIERIPQINEFLHLKVFLSDT